MGQSYTLEKIKRKTMKIKTITKVGRQEVYDLSVNEAEHYVLKNGVVTHNTGIYYSASNIWIIGRRQEKLGTEIAGYHFVINIEKSRYVKEKTKIPISVTFDGGIAKYSGLIDLAIEAGMINKDGQFCQLIDFKTNEIDPQQTKVRPKNIPDSFWKGLIVYEPFYSFIKNKYTLGLRQMISEDQEGLESNDIDSDDEID